MRVKAGDVGEGYGETGEGCNAEFEWVEVALSG